MLQLKDLFKQYQTGDFVQTALDHVSLALRDNEFVAILGPSGSGKTTLLNILGGLDRYDSGELIINGTSTKEYRDGDWDSYRNHHIGFVFQNYHLIPHQSILANVELSLTLSGIGKEERHRRAEEALKKVGLQEHIHKKPNQLSGGQMQRVAIARALVNDPDIILADEPTGALDSETGVQVMELLKEVAKDRLVVMVTHAPELAEAYATRIIRLKDGAVISDSAPALPESDVAEQKQNMNRSKLCFLTAMTLSFHNLLTKKGRTLLISFAGAIGIIGIALILALSGGMNDYIADMETETMGSYPIELEQTTLDFSAGEGGMIPGGMAGMPGGMGGGMMPGGEGGRGDAPSNMLGGEMPENFDPGNMPGGEMPENFDPENMPEGMPEDFDPENMPEGFEGGGFPNFQGGIYSDNVVADFVAPRDDIMVENDLGTFKAYLEEHFASISQSITAVEYGYSITPQVYRMDEESEEVIKVSPASLDDDSDRGMVISGSTSSVWTSLVEDETLRESQYELLAGEWPSAYNEVALVVNEDNEITDYTLYVLGLLDINDMYDLIEAAEEDEEYEDSVAVLSYEDAIGLTYQVFAPGSLYTQSGDAWVDQSDDMDYMADVYDDGITVKVTAVLRAGDGASAGGTVAYDADLSLYLMEIAAESDVVQAQLADPDTNVLTGEAFEDEDDSDDEDEEEDTEVTQTSATSSVSGLTFASYQTGSNVTFAMTEKSNGETTEGSNGETTEESKDTSAGTDLPDDENTGGSGDAESSEEDDSAAVYQVRFLNYDGTLLSDAAEYSAGAKITNLPQTDPERPATEQSSYLFIGWTSSVNGAYYETADLPVVTASVDYTAVYYEQFADGSFGDMPAGMSGSFSGMGGGGSMNLSDDQLSVLKAQMSGSTPSTYADVLETLGYGTEEQPTSILLYPYDFDSKNQIYAFIDEYNAQVEEESQGVTYNDMTETLTSSLTSMVNTISYILIAFVAVSLIVSSIMIAIITYISVLERNKEIGILRALGASKNDISKIFNAETFIEGLLSGVIGIVVAFLLCFPVNKIIYSMVGVESLASMPVLYSALLIGLSILLTLIAGFIPSRMAAKKDPVKALRSE